MKIKSIGFNLKTRKSDKKDSDFNLTWVLASMISLTNFSPFLNFSVARVPVESRTSSAKSLLFSKDCLTSLALASAFSLTVLIVSAEEFVKEKLILLLHYHFIVKIFNNTYISESYLFSF